MSQLNAYVEAETQRRKYYADLAQYVAFWVVNGRRTKGMEIIPIEEWDPAHLMDSLRADRNKKAKDEPSRQQISAERKAELAKNMDRQAYMEHHKNIAKQNNKQK